MSDTDPDLTTLIADMRTRARFRRRDVVLTSEEVQRLVDAVERLSGEVSDLTDALAAAESDADRLTRERDDARAAQEEAESNEGVAVAEAEAAEAEAADLRTRLADAGATVQRVRHLALDWPCSDETCDGECSGCAYARDLNAALDGPQDGGEGR